MNMHVNTSAHSGVWATSSAFDSTCLYLDDGTYTAIAHIIQAEIHEH